MTTPFTRLALLDRGATAMRVVQAVRDLDGRRVAPIHIVTFHVDRDDRSRWVRETDEAVALGPEAPVDLDVLEAALLAARIDVVWAGPELVDDRSALAERCAAFGIGYVGPDAATRRRLDGRVAAAAATRPADADPERHARRLEAQIATDGPDTTWVLGLRDASLRRHGREVISESAAPALAADAEQAAIAAALAAVDGTGLRGLATVTLDLGDPDTEPVLIAVDTDLHADHAVTEATTDVDLVRLALHLGEGGLLTGPAPTPTGVALAAHVTAHDPTRGFVPTPGLLELVRLPTGPGVRVDTGVAEGDVVPPGFDPHLATIVAWGPDRDEALARLRRALGETTIVVRDGATTGGYLLDLVGRPQVRAGDYDLGWLDHEEAQHGFVPSRHLGLALAVCALEVAEAEDELARTRFYGWARRGRPQLDLAVGRTVELRHGGNTYAPVVHRLGPRRWRIELDGAKVEVDLDRIGTHERRLVVGGVTHRVVATRQGTDYLVDVDGVIHRVSRDEGGLVCSPAPAVVVAIPVAEGDEVAAGDTVAVVESMKMETVVPAPFAGRVRHVLSGTNVQVDAGVALVQLEPVGAPDVGDRAERATLSPAGAPDPAASAEVRCRINGRLLEWLLLGYDVPDADLRRILDEQPELCRELGAAHPAVLETEHRILRLFADLRALTRHRDATTDADEVVRSPNEYLDEFLRSLDAEAEGLPERYVRLLERVVGAYGLTGLDRTPALEEAMFRVFRSLQRVEPQRTAVLAILGRRLEEADRLADTVGSDFREVLDRLIAATQARDPVVADLAWEVRYRSYDWPLFEATRLAAYERIAEHVAALSADPDGPDRDEHIQALIDCPRPLAPQLTARIERTTGPERWALLETLTRRFYRMRDLQRFAIEHVDGTGMLVSEYELDGRHLRLAAVYLNLDDLAKVARAVAAWAADLPDGVEVVVDFYAEHHERGEPDVLVADLAAVLTNVRFPPSVVRIVVAATRADAGSGMSAVDLFTFRPDADGVLVEDTNLRGLHPMMAYRLRLWRLENFELQRLPAEEDVYLFHGVARDNPQDERLFAVAEVRDLTPVRDDDGRVVALPELAYMLNGALEGIRRFQARRPPNRRLQWNRVMLYVWPPIELDADDIRAVSATLTPATRGLGIEATIVSGRLREHPGGPLVDRVIRVSSPAGSGMMVQIGEPPTTPLRVLDEYTRKVVQARRRGTVYPYELVKMLAPPEGSDSGLPPGDFVEHDLDDDGRLVPVDRPPGRNESGIVVGVVRNVTTRYPEGMTRVVLFGDPTRALGSIAEPECDRISAGLDLAEEMGVPLEWFALSAGAKIAMDSGTENMDGVAAVLRRLIEFTQAGGEVNVVVTGINVGAQPYWNAEATMLMHTRGILVMTPDSAMVLTGKQALDYSGGVSAEDNYGIGGYERVMGPNGQAQYWARDLAGACRVLLAHYEHAYVAPGERFPRRAGTDDPFDRDIGGYPHRAGGSEFVSVGEIFSPITNAERKKAFDIRTVMRATVDQDHRTLERWAAMGDAETGVVWDAHLGGWPVTLIGIESRAQQRRGPVPADGPDVWTSGTLFPMSSKKIARAVNATSGSRPLVVLANLSGFDGSPESLRRTQLEFGAEIGRAIVNFDGPIVFCVVSRFHGGAFVVFSKRLNDDLEAIAVEGSRASVIGGAPAAAVVFAHEVDVRTSRDPRVARLEASLADAQGTERERLRAELGVVRPVVHSEKLGELAAEFDAVHSVERALRVGSIDAIIPATAIRPYLIDALDRGVRRALDELGLPR